MQFYFYHSHLMSRTFLVVNPLILEIGTFWFCLSHLVRRAPTFHLHTLLKSYSRHYWDMIKYMNNNTFGTLCMIFLAKIPKMPNISLEVLQHLPYICQWFRYAAFVLGFKSNRYISKKGKIMSYWILQRSWLTTSGYSKAR